MPIPRRRQTSLTLANTPPSTCTLWRIASSSSPSLGTYIVRSRCLRTKLQYQKGAGARNELLYRKRLWLVSRLSDSPLRNSSTPRHSRRSKPRSNMARWSTVPALEAAIASHRRLDELRNIELKFHSIRAQHCEGRPKETKSWTPPRRMTGNAPPAFLRQLSRTAGRSACALARRADLALLTAEPLACGGPRRTRDIGKCPRCLGRAVRRTPPMCGHRCFTMITTVVQ